MKKGWLGGSKGGFDERQRWWWGCSGLSEIMEGCEESGGGSHGGHFEWLGTEETSQVWSFFYMEKIKFFKVNLCLGESRCV